MAFKMNPNWHDEEMQEPAHAPKGEHGMSHGAGHHPPHIHVHHAAGKAHVHVMHHDQEPEHHVHEANDADAIAQHIHQHYGDGGGEASMSAEEPPEEPITTV